MHVWMKRFALLTLTTVVVGCVAPAEDDKSAVPTVVTGNTASTDSSQSSGSAVVRRDVRSECEDELVRLEDCGQATADERDVLESMLCESAELSEGQIATVVDCLAQWECHEASPACLEDTDPAPQCSGDEGCADGMTCSGGVCQPTSTEGGSCQNVSYARGSVGNGTLQGATGESCTLPGECRSEICVIASAGGGDVTSDEGWCGNKGDCRNPQNADEECPSGWSCQEVLQSSFDDAPRWLCVAPSVDQCG